MAFRAYLNLLQAIAPLLLFPPLKFKLSFGRDFYLVCLSEALPKGGQAYQSVLPGKANDLCSVL